MAVEKNESDLTEDLAAPSRQSWFKVRSRKGHALSYTAAAFAGVVVIFGLGVLTGMSISDWNWLSAIIAKNQ